MSRRPWVNYGLIAANVLLYVMGFGGEHAQALPWMLHPHSPTLMQFFSSTFMHGSFMHLLGNMVFLWVFGNALNDRLGHAGYLAFYLAGGVLSNVGYVLLVGHSMIPLLGASGAISGVTGAYLVLFPKVRVTLLAFIFYFITFFELSSLYFLLFQFGWNLLMTLGRMAGPVGGGVAYAAHSAGYLYGIAVAAVLLAIRALPREPFDLLSLITANRRRARFRRMVAEGYDPFSTVGPRMQPGVQRPGRRGQTPSASPREMKLREQIAQALRNHDYGSAADNYLQLIQLSEDAVLPQNQQLDIANQLMSEERHPQAADAYERLLKHYPAYEHLGDIHLMLGLLYGRYLHQYDLAEQHLGEAIDRLRERRKIDFAHNELRSVQARRER
ncbi:MAG: rhomboid family intramembrane serine protease [Phycisphaerae bacterium]